MGQYHKPTDGLPVYANFDSVINDEGMTLRTVISNIREMILNIGSDEYDVVIIGSGSAGISAAYALKDSPYRVCLIEKQATIGGTAINAWMNCFAASGDVPFLKSITESLIEAGDAQYVTTRYQQFSSSALANVVYDDTIVEQRFIQNGRTEACVCYDPDALRARYLSDISHNMRIMTSAELVAASKTGSSISSVTVSVNGTPEVIKGKVFIDCTGDDVLLRLVENPTYIGSDASNRYQSEYGFTESHAGSSSISTALNYPSLIYRLDVGTEDLSGVTAGYSRDVLPYYNPDKVYIYVNPLATLASNDAKGSNVVSDGVDAVYNRLQPRTLQEWKTIKTNGGVSQAVLNHYTWSERKYSSAAPMLGIRETYRAKCERMLNENHFYVRVSSSNITSGDNLDKKIAYGNHIADSHGDNSINIAAINTNLVPYGVPYGSIVPKGLTNVLVASRGAGMTHIGACSFRLNKDVMQLGYAAGKAALLYRENNLSDMRDVNVETLQSSGYTNFVGLVSRLEAYTG